MGLDENEVTMVQIDGPKRHVYIKFYDNNRLQDVLHLTGRQVEYRRTNGEISIGDSKALDRVVRGFDLTDVWETIPQSYIYALYPTWSGTLFMSPILVVFTSEQNINLW